MDFAPSSRSVGGITLHPFRRQFGLDSDASFFDELNKVNWDRQPADRNKYAVDIDTLYPPSVISSFQPHVILFPEIGQTSASRIVDVKASEAMQMVLAQSSLVMLEPSLAPAHLHALRNLVSATRHYRLIAGTDVYENPHTFAELVESVVNA